MVLLLKPWGQKARASWLQGSTVPVPAGPRNNFWSGQLSSTSFTYLLKGDRSQALQIPKLRMSLFLLHLQEFQP